MTIGLGMVPDPHLASYPTPVRETNDSILKRRAEAEIERDIRLWDLNRLSYGELSDAAKAVADERLARQRAFKDEQRREAEAKAAEHARAAEAARQRDAHASWQDDPASQLDVLRSFIGNKLRTANMDLRMACQEIDVLKAVVLQLAARIEVLEQQ
jgi:hypothetical protein